jgi:hypothetical protein
MTDPVYTPTPGCKCPACLAQLPPPELAGEALETKLLGMLTDTGRKCQHSLELMQWVNASLVYCPLPAPTERAMLQWGVDRYNVDCTLYVAITNALVAADSSYTKQLLVPPRALTIDIALAELGNSRAAAIRIATERGGVEA